MTTQAAPSPKHEKPRKPVNLAPASRSVQIATAGAGLLLLILAAVSRPNLGLLFAASPIIQLHVYAAVSALFLGGAILVLRKGRTFHKTAGWVWVVLMMTLAIASLFITEITPGHFSLIHILSGWVIIAAPLAIWMVRRGNISTHRRSMTLIWLGGLIIAGAFTFLPGRLMWMVFLHH
jgi:uncharacterized membrane protein